MLNAQRLISIVHMLKSLEEVMTFDLIPELEAAGKYNITATTHFRTLASHNAQTIDHLVACERATARIALMLDTLANDLNDIVEELKSEGLKPADPDDDPDDEEDDDLDDDEED